MNANHLAKLDDFMLNLLFEFSIEYDIQGIREAKTKEKAEKAKNAPPPDDVLKALGY